MTPEQELAHLHGAIVAWQTCAAHIQALFPDLMDEMDELVPAPIKKCIARAGEITGWP